MQTPETDSETDSETGFETTSERMEASRNSPGVSAPSQSDMVARGARARLRQSLFGVDTPPPTIGRFVFLRPLGAGGMGTVSAAYDPTLRREVAIKVVRGQGDARAQTRLVREAQAIAKVKHPNVIAVYEVGELGDAVFIAMELVDGPNLHVWGQGAHSLRERLSALVQAGEGLAAAHGCGLVHCDFKPQNCIIDGSGRVRVVDFGLARAMVEAETVTGAQGVSDDDRPRATSTVGTSGTPRYMAPEQARGEGVDTRSDQFSFAVSGFELLTGRHPFGAESGEHDPKSASTSDIRWGDSDVPGHVREVLARALSADPAERFESMDALVSALRVDASASRRVVGLVAAAAGVAVVGVVVGFATASSEAESGCDAGALDAAWNPDRRREVEAALRSVPVPHAEAAWERVEPALEGHAQQVREGLLALCDAPPRASEPQAVRASALRRACLDERVRELEATVEVFARADRDVLRRWPAVLGGLGPVAQCDDLPALLAAEVVPPPPERERAVAAVRAQVARANALRVAGKLELAEAEAAEALQAARATEHGPTVAHALINLGDSHRFARRADEARRLYEEAFSLGMRFDDRESVLEASDAIVRILGSMGTDDSAVQAWSTVALAALQRLGNVPRLRFHWLTTQGAVAMAQRNGARALEVFTERAALGQAHPGIDPDPLGSQLDLAVALSASGKHEDAYVQILDVARLHAERLGPEHPDYGRALANAGAIAGQLERHEAALGHFRDAQTVLRQSLPAGHPDIAKLQIGVAASLGSTGRDAEAVTLLEGTMEALLESYPEDHPIIADVSANLGRSLANLDRDGEARQAYARALTINEARLGTEHPKTRKVSKALDALGTAP